MFEKEKLNILSMMDTKQIKYLNIRCCHREWAEEIAS